MVIENYMGTSLVNNDIQTCVKPGDTGHQQPKDYSSYLNFIAVYIGLTQLLFILFFDTEMKRSKADE